MRRAMFVRDTWCRGMGWVAVRRHSNFSIQTLEVSTTTSIDWFSRKWLLILKFNSSFSRH